MSAPTPAVRRMTYERDGGRCVSCGGTELQFQHRRATGMGGSKRRPEFTDGLTSCGTCNPAYEGRLQAAALRFGWKVARWVASPGRVPVWFVLERQWFLLAATGVRTPISAVEAMEAMHEVYGDRYVPGEGLIR